MRARCSQIRSRWTHLQRPPTHTWAAGHRRQLQRFSCYTSRRRNPPKSRRRGVSTHKIRTDQEHVGHHLGGDQCLQAHFPSTQTRITHPRQSLPTRAALQTCVRRLAGQKLTPPRPHPLFSSNLQHRPRPKLLSRLQTNSILTLHLYYNLPNHLRNHNRCRPSLGRRAPSRTRKTPSLNRRARRVHKDPSPILLNRPSPYGQGKTSV